MNRHVEERDVQRRARRKKIRDKSRLMRRKIDSKKYWGVGVNIQQYRDTVVDSVNTEPLRDALQGFESTLTESLIDDLMQQIDFSQLFEAVVLDKLQEVLAESFKKGGSRVLTVDGEKLDPFDVSPERIIGQLQQQEIFLKNLSNDAEERVRDILVQGVEQGKTIGEMQDDIVTGVEDMVESRAETIARSEVIKASSRGTEEAMKEAGVERVIWVSAEDDRVCEFCQDLNESIWDREEAPQPVSDSHPNCRCILVADID